MRFSRTTRALALLFSFITFSPILAAAEELYDAGWRSQMCFGGCWNAIDYLTWDTPADLLTLEYYPAFCQFDLKIKSIYYCSQAYCSLEETNAGIEHLNESCVTEGKVSLPSFESIRLPESELAKLPVVDADARTTTLEAPLNHTVLPTKEYAALGERTETAFYRTWYLGVDLMWPLIGFWGLALLVGMSHRLMELHSNSKQRAARRNNQADYPDSIAWTWFRRTFILPATFGKHCQDPIAWSTIPPRLESTLLVIYMLLQFAMMFPGYDLFQGNMFYPEKKAQLARYIADRSGYLSVAQVPMIWIFSARNDPFLWMTGWSFATYTRFHRWVARASTIHAIIHSICYTLVYYWFTNDWSYYKLEWVERWWYCGVIATIVMSMLLGLSVYKIRQKCYDLFLITHIVLSAVFLATLWFHVEIFTGAFDGFIWPAVAIWSIDRLLRLGRMVYLSVIPRFTKGVKATASYDQASDIIRMDISSYLTEKKVVPGHYYYVYFPSGPRSYESHPLTLCSYVDAPSSTPSSPISPSSSTVTSFGKDIETTVQELQYRSSQGGKVSHSLIVRPYSGSTGRLRDKIVEAQKVQATPQMSVYLEGPYGDKIDLSRFSDVLIITGGAGITAVVSHSNFLLPTGNTSVHVVWAVPQRQLADNICAHELASAVTNPRFDMTVHLTENDGNVSDKVSRDGQYTVRYGRPDLDAAMREARAKCTSNLAVVTCGTEGMADACRAAVVSLLKEPGRNVEWFNDSQTW